MILEGVAPEGLHVGGSLDLRDTGVTQLPEGLRVGGSLDLRDTGVTQLPEGLHVGGSLYLRGTGVTQLPEGLHVGGYLDLEGTGIPILYYDDRGYFLVRVGERYIAGCRNFEKHEALRHWGSNQYPNKKRGKSYCDAILAEEKRRGNESDS